MGNPGYGMGLDTPRTNVGDATYLSRAPDFADISQEASFHSPVKEGLLQQLRGGRSAANLRTPRRRGPLADRQNLPPSVGGAEFTPLLKSATRNSVRRNGKENRASLGQATPAALNRIDEDDMTPLPRMDASMYTGSRSQSYLENTLPQVEASSAASTPLALPPRRGGDKGPLNDGNQLSLREQENVIDRIEKENFGLKLKIHFLEDALRKAGPGFSEAALKENTELKVDKVTMQRELSRYKKHITTAERDLETYRQQMLELQEKAKRKYADENARAEMDKLQQHVEERDARIEELERQLEETQQGDNERVSKLQDDIGDLEAEIREKDGQIDERDEEIEDLKDKLGEAEEKVKDAERKVVGSEEADGEKEDLEHDIRRLEEQLEEANEKAEDAIADKKRAEEDLAELQEEMANKSIVTKGSSRQSDEKMARLQQELDDSENAYADIEKQLTEANRQRDELEATLSELQSQKLSSNDKDARIRELEAELMAQADEKDLLQTRRDELAQDVQLLQSEVDKLEQEVADLEASLEDEREHALEIEKNARTQRTDELERLNDEISDLQAEIREKDNLYDTDSDKWETEKQTLESARERAEEKAAGLQRTIDKLREVEGNLSDKETRLQEAMQSETDRHKNEESLLTRRVDELQDALETRQSLLTNLRNELSTVRDELRQATVDRQAQLDKIAALEDEVDVLQNALEVSGSQQTEVAQVRRERDELRRQVEVLQRRSPAKSPRAPNHLDEAAAARLKWQLSDVTAQRDEAIRGKQSLQGQLSVVTAELDSLKSSLAEVTAERDELDAELHRTAKADSSMLRGDHDRLNLRTAKMKLENEVRRLKDENKALADQRDAIEQTLEQEINKAAEEEERLGQEIRQLQARLRSPSDSYELTAARRSIRELERRVEDYEAQLAAISATGPADRSVHDVSIVRKDLAAARQKELDFVQREAANRETVKSLKHQIADLEHELHEKEIAQLIGSPATARGTPDRDSGSAQLRQQLISVRQSMNEMKASHREAEHASAEELQALQQQLEETEDQKIVLEELLDDARQQAEELTAQHEKALRRLKLKLEQAQRDAAAAAPATSNVAPSTKTDRNLRKSQTEIANLEHDVRQQQEMLDALVASEASLRRKLERARSERAEYRLTAEKLQKQLRKATKLAQAPQAEDAREAIETVVRAAEGAETRHKKELRGAIVQMEWMQKRWEREASLRSDAAYAKKFLQLQLDVANAWYVLTVPRTGPMVTLTFCVATKLNFATSNPSALGFWAAASHYLRPRNQELRLPPLVVLHYVPCSSRQDLWPRHVSRRECGASRRLCGRSWLERRRRRRGRGGRGSCASWRQRTHEPDL